MTFRPIRESREEEVARLLTHTPGSFMHSLATLPENISEWPRDKIIQLPNQHPTGDGTGEIAVLPYRYRPSNSDSRVPRERNPGSWSCVVVASTHPSYPVGGYDIEVPTVLLVRGREVSIDLVTTPKDHR